MFGKKGDHSAQYLGGYGAAQTISASVSANNITNPGMYTWGSYQSVPQDLPNVAMAGAMEVKCPRDNMVIQTVYFNGNSTIPPSVYERIKWGDSWFNWGKVVLQMT